MLHQAMRNEQHLMANGVLNTSRLARRAHLLGDFLAVVRAGGVRQAADHLSVTQSALTRRIQDLERALGVSLFERSARGMTLTAFGQALRHHAELVEMNCSYAVAEIGGLLDGAGGELRIGAGPAWAYELAPRAVAEVKRRLPGVAVHVLVRMNRHTLPMLVAGQLDVVLGGLPPVEHRAPELVHEPLIEVEHQVFASARHPLHGLARIGAVDLAAQPWVWFTEAVTGREPHRNFFKEAGLEPPVASIETNSVHFGFEVLQDARHLMQLPSTLANAAARQALQPLRLEPTLGRYEAGLMYRSSMLRIGAFSTFRESLFGQVQRMELGTRTPAPPASPAR